MRIFALELDNDIKGIDKRKEYIEQLIGKFVKTGIGRSSGAGTL